MVANNSIPYLITVDTLLSHGLIVGATGAGKSSRFLYPAVAGLCRLIAAGESITIIILDMKGEPWLFHAIRSLVAKLNEQRSSESQITYRWLNPTANRSSFGWNPFNQEFFYQQRRESRVQMLVKALGSDFGDFYGAKHFRAQGELLLRQIFTRFHVHSYKHLDALVTQHRGKTEWFDKLLDKDSREFQSGISQMGQVECLNVCVEDDLFHPRSDCPLPLGHYGKDVLDHHIEMSDVITRPQVIYLNLTTITENSVGRAIPRAFLWQLLANLKWLEHEQTNKVILFADEMQWLATQSTNIDHVYTQARQAGLSIIATLQDMHQVENDRLARILSKNAGFEIWFDEPPEWRLRSQPFSSNSSGLSFDEIQYDDTLGVVCVANPRTTPSANPFGKPQLNRFRYALSLEKYMQFCIADWPTVEDAPGTLVSIAEENICVQSQLLVKNIASPSKHKLQPHNSDDLITRLRAAVASSDIPLDSPSAPQENLSTKSGRKFVDNVMRRAEQLISKRFSSSGS